MSKKSWTPLPRRGITLVEVVAGLALLATLLVAILTAYRAHLGQMRQAQYRLGALAAAEQLLNGWSQAGGWPQPGETGTIDEDRPFAWRMSSDRAIVLGRAEIETRRLELMAVESAPGARPLASVTFAAVLEPGEQRP